MNGANLRHLKWGWDGFSYIECVLGRPTGEAETLTRGLLEDVVYFGVVPLRKFKMLPYAMKH